MFYKLRVFHPACEISIANPLPNLNLPALIEQFEFDLDVIPYYFCAENEKVLVTSYPSIEFKKYLHKLVDFNAHFVSYDELSSKSDSFILEAWCNSPYLVERLNKYKSIRFDGNYNLKQMKQFQSKLSALDFCKSLNNGDKSFLISKSDLGKVFYDFDKLVEYVETQEAVVVKIPISSSGRGNLFLRKTELGDYHKQWIKSFLDKQKALIVEPFWNKILDLAAVFEFSDTEVKFLGLSVFQTNSSGFYQSSSLNYSIDKLKSKFSEIDFDYWINTLKSKLEKSVAFKDFRGVLGVDAMIVLDKEDELLLHPCLEINARYTMGLFALNLERIIAPTAVGKMYIYYKKGKSFGEFSSEMQVKFPQEWKREKAFRGFFPLVEPNQQKQFGAYMLLD